MRSKVKHPILEGINFKNRESLFGITDSVLELTTEQQQNFVLELLDSYDLGSKTSANKNISDFLAQDVFEKHRRNIVAINDELDANDF